MSLTMRSPSTRRPSVASSRGSGSKSSNKEKTIRAALVEQNVIEGVVLLPENLFYNTSAPGVILLLNRGKPEARKGQILLVNASAYFVKRKPKNELTEDGIAAVTDAYRAWESREKLSRVISLAEARTADYNLSPSQFVIVTDRAQHRPLDTILADIAEARIERERADAELARVLEAVKRKDMVQTSLTVCSDCSAAFQAVRSTTAGGKPVLQLSR